MLNVSTASALATDARHERPLLAKPDTRRESTENLMQESPHFYAKSVEIIFSFGAPTTSRTLASLTRAGDAVAPS